MRPLLLALALLAGCETTRPCRGLTLLVDVTLDATSAAADRVDVDVAIDGTLSKTNSFGHVPGDPTGTIEIDFPNGYPAGHSIGITVRADANNTTIGTGAGAVTLPDDCATLAVPVTASP